MLSQSALALAYLAAAILFVLGIKGLSKQETARQGNLIGILGMFVALGATLVQPEVVSYPMVIGAIVVGGAIGAFLAKTVAMTGMPELVGLLNALGGLAAVFVGFGDHYRMSQPDQFLEGTDLIVHQVEVWVGVAIGMVTFTGSVVAWGKLRGTFNRQPVLLPGRHLLNLGMLGAVIGLAVPFVQGSGSSAAEIEAVVPYLGIMTAVAAVLGIHLVFAIGGADMPVVISLLNSYSGWAAASSGFLLNNDLLIVTGAIVGSSGLILTLIMCRAMNRSIMNVAFGGVGATPKKKKKSDGAEPEMETREATETDAERLAADLSAAKKVVIVPGYGMAVARAQHSVKEMVTHLRDHGVEVSFAIHPVAGRLPGHMNVLLAEAGVPYDIVKEMDEVNPELPRTDVTLVIGANDIVNPAANTEEGSPIYGMPVIEVWKATQCVVFKRSLGAGYAGVENPLFFEENTNMLFGDAKKSVDAILVALRSA